MVSYLFSDINSTPYSLISLPTTFLCDTHCCSLLVCFQLKKSAELYIDTYGNAATQSHVIRAAQIIYITWFAVVDTATYVHSADDPENLLYGLVPIILNL